jgi:hypothetical protein
MDPMLIHMITGLSVQGTDPHQFYLEKSVDCSMEQRIKYTYGNLDKGKRG